MMGSAALYAAASCPIGGVGGRDRGLAGGGFELMFTEFQVAADEFDQLVEFELRRGRTEHDQARAACPVEGSPYLRASNPVPPWVAEAERGWCAQRHQLLTDLAGAGPALRATAADYQQTDARLATTLAALADDCASGGLPNPLTGDPVTAAPTRAARGNPTPGAADRRPYVPGDPARPTTGGADPASLSEALALWQTRSSDAAQLTDLLTATAMAVPSWRGDTAHVYQQWLTSLTESCHRLRDDARRVHRELALLDPTIATNSSSAGPPAAPANGVTATTLPDVATQAAPATRIPNIPHTDTPATAPPPTLFLPDSVWQHPHSLTPAAPPPESGCPPNTAPPLPDDLPTPNQACDEPPRGNNHDARNGPGRDDQHHHDADQNENDGCRNGTDSSTTDQNSTDSSGADDNSADDGRGSSGGRCDDSPTDTDGAPDLTDNDPGTAPGGPAGEQDSPDREDAAPPPRLPAPTPEPTPAPEPTPTPTPAPTPAPSTKPSEPKTAAPDGPPPPAQVGPVHPTSSHADSTALLVGVGATAAAAATAAVLLARRERARTPRTPDITETTTPIPRLGQVPDPQPDRAPDLADPPIDVAAAAATRGDDRARPALAAARDADRRDQHPSPAARRWAGAQPWLPIGVHHGHPVLIDLAAAHGLGLTGPAALPVARALLHRLLDLQPPCVFVADADTANELLGQPNDSPITPTHSTNHTRDRADEDEQGRAPLRVTSDPFTGLQVIEAELVRRRCTPAPPEGWPLWLLLAPAPTTTPAQHRLDATLTAGQFLGIGAILTGWWPTGWNCHIDDDHHVTHHTGADDDALADTLADSPTPNSPGHGGPTTPAHLIGAQLHTSTIAELRDAFAHATPQPTDDDPGTRPLSEDPAPATPHHRSPRKSTHSDTQSDAHIDTHGDVGGALEHGIPPEHQHASQPDTQHSTGPDDPQPDESLPAAGVVAEQSAPSPARPTTQSPTPGDAGATPAGAAGPTGPPLWLSILGPAILRYTPQPDTGALLGADGAPARTGLTIDRLGPRATELLVYLAVHPTGVHRDNLVAALWPDADRSRPTNALNATLARLRKTLRATGDPHLAHVITHLGDRYLLDSDLIGVDYWTFLIAAADITHPDTDHRAHACDTAIRTYQGHLAADLTSEWLITLREATRRRYFDALTALARLTIHHDPERTLALLETARNLDPLKEGIYRDIMRIQAQLDRPEAAENTLALLRAQLADIDTEPDDETLQLAATIHARASRHNASDTTAPTG